MLFRLLFLFLFVFSFVTPTLAQRGSGRCWWYHPDRYWYNGWEPFFKYWTYRYRLDQWVQKGWVLSLVILLFLSSCRQEKEYHCPPASNPDSFMPNEMAAYFNFKKGSYWVFQNQVNGRKDTIKVLENPRFSYLEEAYPYTDSDGKRKVMYCNLAQGGYFYRFLIGNDTIYNTLYRITGGCFSSFYKILRSDTGNKFLYYDIAFRCYNDSIFQYEKWIQEKNKNKYTLLIAKNKTDIVNQIRIIQLSEFFEYQNFDINHKYGFSSYFNKDTTFTLIDSRLIR